MPSQHRNPFTYPRSGDPFDPDLFANPSAEYRGSPFWSWNTKLEKDKLLRQLDVFEKMGMGGFHVHSRVGLDTEYLGDEFMDLIKASVEKAKEKNMLACLYDEDRWPSGYAGGLVLKDHPEFRSLHFLLTPWKYGEAPPSSMPVGNRTSSSPVRSELGQLITRYNISLDSDGKLASAKRLTPDECGQNVWYLYSETNPPSEFYNGNTYVDVLNKAAIEHFTTTTHDVFRAVVGHEFGSVVPSIFTDEPQFPAKLLLHTALAKQDILGPWTADFPTTFKAAYGYDILDRLPEIMWDLPGDAPSTARFHYHDHISERFVDSFLGTISKWCRANGILSAGHMIREPTLTLQTQSLGEAMRCYRDMDIPGMDQLCDQREFTTAKQAQSVARQNGLRGMVCEQYGVTNWTFTFEGHKGQGDWQAALGITLRVHHLAWASMAGEAKRDYPAAIGYQSPWYEVYKHVEDHFCRLNVALTRGTPVCRVAVIHPIESFWLRYGPHDQCSDELKFREDAFLDLTNWLLLGHIDFDFISESLFPSQTPEDKISGKTLPVGKCQYDVIIVPNLLTIRSTTLSRLRKFSASGGTVIIAGMAPAFVDAAVPQNPPTISGAASVFWSKQHVLKALEPFRDVSVTLNEATLYRRVGDRADSLLYQMRADGEERFVFICNVDRKEAVPAEVALKGVWALEVLDTQTGKSWELKATQRDGWTLFNYWFDGCASLLLRLTPGGHSASAIQQFSLKKSLKEVDEVVLHSVELSEPNVLLLDYAEYCWDDGPWAQAEEVLRIDNIIRDKLKLPLKSASSRQPWTIPPDNRQPHGTLKLRFTFNSEVDIPGEVQLALEDAESLGIALDGHTVPSVVTGWWVDEDIKTVKMPPISRGEHTLEITYGFGLLTNIERMYVLGDFGVSVHGRNVTIFRLDLSKVAFGDYTNQGLPFYAGNLTYHCTFDSHGGGRTALQVTRFAAPVVAVQLDGQSAGLIAYEPRILDFGDITPGKHSLAITSYGNRNNAFGAIHLPDGLTDWYGPDAWRTDYDWWTREYNLAKMGVLETPKIKKYGKDEPEGRKGYRFELKPV